MKSCVTLFLTDKNFHIRWSFLDEDAPKRKSKSYSQVIIAWGNAQVKDECWAVLG
jgi:hypothetical protein